MPDSQQDPENPPPHSEDAMSDTPGTATAPPRTKRNFPQISSRAFEHPTDRAALNGLRKVPGFDWVIRKFLTAIGEKRVRLYFLATAVRVTDNQFVRVKKLYDEACWILDVEDPPELYVSQDPFVNAMAIGVDKPFIVLHSAIVDLLDDEELQCVMGHELGHVMCGHALYRTLLLLLLRLTFFFTGIPFGIMGLYAIILALLEWYRKAELTSDRAGLLTSQSIDVSQRVLMKLAGGRRGSECSVEEFRKQAREYEAHGDLVDGVLKVMLLMWQTHPFPVLRVDELDKWVKSGDYQKILDRQYELRGNPPTDSWFEDIRKSAASYKEGIDNSTDPLVSFIRDIGSNIAAAGSSVVDFIRRTATGGEKKDGDGDKKDGDKKDGDDKGGTGGSGGSGSGGSGDSGGSGGGKA